MSVTVRVIGPSDPRRDGQPAHTPPRLTSPGVGRMPTMLFQVEGRRIEAKPFLADADGGEVRRHRRAGAARRSADRALEVVGIARDAVERAVGVAAAHLAERHLGEDDRAGLLQLRR